MAEERVQRRLAAILAADVVGYSRLMGEDEAGTRAQFNAHLAELIEPTIASRRGRIVKITGDALLVEFASVVDAVQCAVEIQSGMAVRNGEEPDHRQIIFRIGVNLGDVIIEGDDIHGDGVNVAARLEALADPGGVLISDKVHSEIRTKLDVGFDDLGPQVVKNIAEPVPVWRARLGSKSAAGGLGVNVATSTPDFGGRPAIAVLPFDSVSGDSEWLADGLTDAVITALSRFSWFVVIDRNTSYAYKHKKVGIAELKKDLGIAYVLEGNLRTAGQRIRVSAQLLDAKSGGNIWADQFDSQTDDPFEMEDKITRAILAELTPRLLGAEARRAQFTSSGSSWDLIMQGRGLLWHVNEADVARAQILFQKAIDMEPDSGLGECDLAWTYIYQRIYGWGGDLKQITVHACEAADKAVAANDHDAFALAASAVARLMAGQSEDGIALARRAIGLNPNLAVAYVPLALGLIQQGRYNEAVEPGETALRLSPRDPLRSIMLAVRGIYFLMLGQKSDLMANARETVRDYPGMPTGYRQLAVAFVEAGQLDQARRVVNEHVLRLLPGHTASNSGRQIPFGENAEARQHWEECLVKAGLPE